MGVSQYIGNGVGTLYVVGTNGSTILGSNANTPKGVRDLRALGATSAPISAVRSAVGTITFTAIGGAGNITAVPVNGVSQIGANVAATVGNTVTTALNVAAAINAFTPATGDNITAVAISNTVYLFTSPSAGAAYNGATLTVSVSNVAITSTCVDFSGGSNETGVYDSTVGLRFYLDPLAGASPTSLSGATEITKYIVVRGLQTGIVTKSLVVNGDRLTGIDRSCAITQIYADTQSSAATDVLAFIETVDFVEGDVVRISEYVAGRVVQLQDASVATIAGNIYLTDQVAFNCENNKSIELRLQYDATLGLIWVENGRSFSGGAVRLTRAEMISLITAGAVSQGQSYLITDAGQSGIIVSGIDSNSITTRGDYIGYFPDYQNVSGDYRWMWSPIMIAPTAGLLYATGGFMYESVTGAIGTNPTTDTVNWTLVSLSDTRYQKNIITVQYDVNSDIITQGVDNNGNVVNGSNSFNTFRWGSVACANNLIVDSNLNVNSIPEAFQGNTIYNSSLGVSTAVYITGMAGNNINYSSIGAFTSSGGGLVLINNQGSFGDLQLTTGAGSVTFTGCLFNASSRTFTITGNGYTITDCFFGAWSQSVSAQYFFSTFQLKNSQIAWPYLTLDQNETQLFVNAETSNHVRTVSLDGADWAANVLTLSSQYSSCGTLRLTAATTKTIDKFVDNFGLTRSITFQPVNTVSVIIAPTAVGVAVTNNIVSDAGSLTLVGRTNGADTYTIKKSGTFWSKLYATKNI